MTKKRLGPTTNLFPMPTLLVAVRTGEGTANVVTIAWAGIVGTNQIALCIDSGHYSTPHIEREGNFTVNIPRSTQAMQADYCGIVSGRKDPDKPRTCGWTMVPSSQISSPMIAECPLNLECRVLRKIDDEESFYFLAEIVETHIDEEVLDEKGEVDAARFDPLIFTPDGQYYKLGPQVAKAFQVGKTLRKQG